MILNIVRALEIIPKNLEKRLDEGDIRVKIEIIQLLLRQ